MSEIGAVFSGLAHFLSHTPYWLVDPMDRIWRTMIRQHWSLSKKLGSATHCSNWSAATLSRHCFCSAVNDFGMIHGHSFHVRRSYTIINRTVSLLFSTEALYRILHKTVQSENYSTYIKQYRVRTIQRTKLKFTRVIADGHPQLAHLIRCL